MSNNNYKIKGFTLIEMLVTALIFSIVSGAIMGVFVSAIKLQRYSLVHQQLLNQVSYAMEYMDRAIRMAVKDDDGDCISAGQNYEVSNENRKIEFKNYKGECQEFFWDINDNQLKVYKTDFGSSLFLTSDDFEVTSFNFQVFGDGMDNDQPRVTLSIDIKAKGSGQQPRIKIQTTVSQRNLDF